MRIDRIGVREALLLFGAVVLLLIGLGSLLFRMGLGGIALAEILLVAAPAVMLAWTRGGVASNLGIAKPRALHVLGAVMIGSSLWYVLASIVLPIQERIIPTPPALEQALQQIAAPDLPIWMTLLIVAVSPAVCEEILCRGVLARTFRTAFGMRSGVIFSALLFGALHMSVYRFVPTFLLGLSLGWVALRGESIFLSMIVHALNNAAVIVISVAGDDVNAFLDTHSLAMAVGAVCLLTGGHALVLLPSKARR